MPDRLPSDAVLVERAVRALRDLHPGLSVALRPERATEADCDLVADLRYGGGACTLVAECKRRLPPSSVAGVRQRLRRAMERLAGRAEHELVPAVAAPYVTPAGFAAVREAGLCAWDFCGNAYIEAPGLLLSVQGRPNRFADPDVVRSAFSPKASRVARLLLSEPEDDWTVTSLAEAAAIDKGYSSRVVSRLSEMQAVDSGDDGRIRVVDAGLILDSWLSRYRPTSEKPARYFVPLDDPEAAMRKVSRALEGSKVRGAFTGSAGANLLEPYMRAGRLDLYWEGALEVVEQAAALSPAERGANFVVYRPYDAFVFHDRREVRGVPVVSDLQLYLDLAHAGGRASEQAESFREKVIAGAGTGGRG